MPGLSGIDFYHELELNYPSLTDRILFMTGDLVQTDVQSFLDEIEANVLRKPFDLTGLYQKVRSILK
jgi:DNA-binding response OmpR family regulator